MSKKTKKNPRKAAFEFKPFSDKQIQVLTWWMLESPYWDKDAIICDGSVRAGKTVAMSLSFVMWAMETFDGMNLAMAGKTISALRRNVIIPLKRMLKSRGYRVEEHLTAHSMTISRNGRTNEFYLFGGRDERSQDDIQGITLAGMFFDEVALMPESFVNQATARCSIDGSKFFFNCNPAGPFHWFKVEWIDKLEEHNALHLHFTMDDNLSLSERIKERYKTMYSGVFYQRYILGLWVLANGLIYDMWHETENTFDDEDMPIALKQIARRYIAIDYGTQNPMVYLDIYDDGDTLWFVDEYYYDGRNRGKQKEDTEYADDLDKVIHGGHIADMNKNFDGGPAPRFVIIDPSAASFKVAVRRRGHRVKDADNDVLEGIKATSIMIAKRKIRVHRRNCPNLLMERAAYVWDEKAVNRGEEKPMKQMDHACDAKRYAVQTIIPKRRIHAA